jgi:hypothetical protein
MFIFMHLKNILSMKKIDKKHSKLASKLASYSAATGAFLAVGTVAQGQVVYTDETPDIYMTGIGPNYHGIDMNTDMTDEFTINQSINFSSYVYTTYSGSVYTSSWTYSYVGISKVNPTDGMMGEYSYKANGLDSGSVVDAADGFILENYSYNIGSNSWGNFEGQGDKYVGVKFDISGETHYGWILINVDSYNSGVTIKGYGYESQAGVGIHAGDTVGVYTDDIIISNITATTADADFFPSATGTTYYVVQPQTDVMPTPAEVVSGTGSTGATVAASGNKAVVAGVDDVFNMTGLTHSTAYAMYVVIVDAAGITSLVDSVPFTTLLNVGLSDNGIENIKVFPVPASDQLTLELNSSGIIVIRDLSGREMYRSEKEAGRSIIDISAFASGTYIIEQQTDDTVSKIKFIKQ